MGQSECHFDALIRTIAQVGQHGLCQGLVELCLLFVESIKLQKADLETGAQLEMVRIPLPEMLGDTPEASRLRSAFDRLRLRDITSLRSSADMRARRLIYDGVGLRWGCICQATLGEGSGQGASETLTEAAAAQEEQQEPSAAVLTADGPAMSASDIGFQHTSTLGFLSSLDFFQVSSALDALGVSPRAHSSRILWTPCSIEYE
eukprot:1185716-Prorocentrum_minimum.AAC.5